MPSSCHQATESRAKNRSQTATVHDARGYRKVAVDVGLIKSIVASKRVVAASSER